MTEAFPQAIADTLFPGDAACPSASAAGLEAHAHVAAHTALLDAIAAKAGGADVFLDADPARRAAILADIERKNPDAFRALTTELAAAFYGLPAVLAAYGWPARPPQPEGYELSDPAAELGPLLAKVAARGPLWRKAD